MSCRVSLNNQHTKTTILPPIRHVLQFEFLSGRRQYGTRLRATVVWIAAAANEQLPRPTARLRRRAPATTYWLRRRRSSTTTNRIRWGRSASSANRIWGRVTTAADWLCWRGAAAIHGVFRPAATIAASISVLRLYWPAAFTASAASNWLP